MSLTHLSKYIWLLAFVVISYAVLLGVESRELVDVMTMKQKVEVTFVGFAIWQKPSYSPFAEFIERKRFLRADEHHPQWRVFRSRTIFNRVSPHYVYHSVPDQANFAMRIAQNLNLHEKEKADLAFEILEQIRLSRSNPPPNILSCVAKYCLGSTENGISE